MFAIHGHTRALYVYTELPSGVGKPAMHDPLSGPPGAPMPVRWHLCRHDDGCGESQAPAEEQGCRFPTRKDSRESQTELSPCLTCSQALGDRVVHRGRCAAPSTLTPQQAVPIAVPKYRAVCASCVRIFVDRPEEL